MEPREWSYIERNLPSLIQNTSCNIGLLATLRSEKLLTKEECGSLEAQCRIYGPETQAYMLYDFLRTRTGSYQILLDALDKLNQSGAVEILKNGENCDFDISRTVSNDDRYSQIQLNFISPPGRFRDVFINKRTPIIVISTFDITLTTERIQAERFQHKFVLFTSTHRLQETLRNTSIALIAVYGKALKIVLNELRSNVGEKRQIIIVTSESLENAQEVTDSLDFPPSTCELINDDLTWMQLSSDFQDTILKRKVKFQNKEISLDNLLNFCNSTQKALLMEKLEAKIFSQLINDERPTVCKNTLEDRPKPKFYISRKIVSRAAAISADILLPESSSKESETAFMISGRRRSDLGHLTTNTDNAVQKSEDVLRTVKKVQGVSTKYIVLNNEKLGKEHFLGLCNKIKSCEASIVKNLHRLKYIPKFDRYEWVRSFGTPESLLRVQKHVIPLTEPEIVAESEENFTKNLIKDTSHLPAVCISDNPGMGKTSLLGHIGEQILSVSDPVETKDVARLKFVQYFNMTDLMRDLEKVNIKNTEKLQRSQILKVLVDRITENEIVRQMFYRKDAFCELMLDGFDEVLPHQASLSVKFISILRHGDGNNVNATGPTFRLWLTTRPVLLPLVEQTLGVLGYHMLPFDENDQKLFLKSHWTEEAKKRNVQLDPEKLEIFTKGSLKTMKRVGGQLSKFEMDMTGLPLQCLLLAQVCERSVNYECSVDGGIEEEMLNDEDEIENLAIKNVADLYNRVMDKKLEIFLNREGSNSHLESHLSKNNKQVMKRIHMKLALELLFPSWSNTFQVIFIHETDISPEELSIYGFVTEYSSNQPVFVHRTYAEYFVALFAVEMGSSERLVKGFNIADPLAKFLNEVMATAPETSKGLPFEVKSEMPEFQMSVLTYFIDELLEIKSSKEPIPRVLLESVKRHFEEIAEGVPFETGSSKMLACVVHDRPNLGNMLIASLDQDAKQKWLEKTSPNHAKMVYFAALRGNKEALSTLCNLLEQWNSQNVASLTFQVTKNPLLAAALIGNLDSVEYLIIQKNFTPDIWAKPEQQILHGVVENTWNEGRRTIDNRKEIIHYLVAHQGTREGNENILEHIDFLDRTPLLLENVHIELRIALIEEGANVQAYNQDGNQVLHMLGRFDGISPTDYENLIVAIETTVQQVYTDIDDIGCIFKNSSGLNLQGHMYTPNWYWHSDTALHLAVGHIEVTDATFDIFATYGFNFNEENSHGYTILHIAVRTGRSMRLIKKLVDLGADWTVENVEGMTVFHEAAQAGYAEVLEWVCNNYELDIDHVDNNGRTSMHYAMLAPEERRREVIKILLENNANPDPICNQENSPLMNALYQDRGVTVDFLKFLRDNNVNFLGIDEEDKVGVVVALCTYADGITDSDNQLSSSLAFLIDEGADIRDPTKNLVHIAASNSWLNGLKVLYKKLGTQAFTELATTTFNEQTAISALCASESEKDTGVLKWIVKTIGEDVLKKPCNTLGSTPLHVCARAGWLEGIELLVGTYKVNIMATDNIGNTVLHEAVHRLGMHSPTVAYLKARMGGDHMQLRNAENETPQEYGDRRAQEESEYYDTLYADFN